MKFKFLLLTVLLSSLSISLFATNLIDSTGVENQNGKKVILHKVEPKETFYSIGRRYNISPKIIIAYNNNSTVLSIGQIIKVPTEQAFAETVAVSKPATQKSVAANNNFSVRSSPASEPQTSATQYKVSAGETLYAIAKRFDTSVADIISLNNLKSNNLVPGQVLLVKSAPQAPQQQVVKQSTTTPPPTSPPPSQQQPPVPVAKRDTTLVVSQDSMDANHHAASSRYGLYEKNEKGVAIWMDNDSLDPNKKLVLHRTAPVGTVIKITNPMTNRTTFAKVVGRFTETEGTKDALMVMTKSVAESLGAIDKRFHVIISYGTPNE
ncbi:Peptidoglycan-binding lysin domain-containing protein [Mucilaginibacter paludis DSM 18603]|uniref:Peptidoglycan-binding lysin domain-containing protein n=2 Tax=Mucilaginibacter TaxID=423349 RepID=H1Y974_9SPHI|nr:Peptidoglycan-binding lysin domain-containing protein [Mucilaginibacter paludis DSM 18603]